MKNLSITWLLNVIYVKRSFIRILILKNNYINVKDHCHYTGKYRSAAHKICNLMYNTSREIPVVFHNVSSYNYNFIKKGLAEEFEGDFEFFSENKEKYIAFSVPIKKESNEDSTIIYTKKNSLIALDLCQHLYQL